MISSCVVTHIVIKCHITMYKSITDSLLDEGAPLASSVKHSYSQVQGRNSYCRELHTLVRDAYLIWGANGKKRQGVLCGSMRPAQAKFKLALRNCRQEEAQICANMLANKLLRKDDQAFWTTTVRLHLLHHWQCYRKGSTSKLF